jgi:hypothetical protein
MAAAMWQDRVPQEKSMQTPRPSFSISKISQRRLAAPMTARPVIGKTGLRTIRLPSRLHRWSSRQAHGQDDPAASDQFGMVSDALKKFGLRLEAANSIAKFVVIYPVERPSGN